MGGVASRADRSIVERRSNAPHERSRTGRTAERLSSHLESRLHVRIYRGTDRPTRSFETRHNSPGEAFHTNRFAEHDPRHVGMKVAELTSGFRRLTLVLTAQ